jgi:hypothetical protein
VVEGIRERSSGGLMTATRAARLRNRLARAIPSAGTVLAGGLFWGLAMAASALAGLLLDQWETPQKVRSVIVLFALGGALAFPIGLFLASLVAQGRRFETAFAAAFLSLAIATIGVTAALYALHYRIYYAEWHDAAFTVRWGFQFVFTVLAALYQFAVLGLRLYFPIGFAALLVASLWFARRAR